jgi:hypothetical protein
VGRRSRREVQFGQSKSAFDSHASEKKKKIAPLFGGLSDKLKRGCSALFLILRISPYRQYQSKLVHEGAGPPLYR